MPEQTQPGPFLLERVLRQGDDEYARRVTGDGRVWVRSTVSARLEDGKWEFGAGDDEWRELALLPPAALAALEDAIRHSGVLDLAPEHDPSSTVIGGSQERWTFALDGRRSTTLLRGVPEVEVPAITEVAEALQVALAAADQGA